MRRTSTLTCPACGARWDAGRARFCGWCGRALRATDLSTDEEAAPRRWPRRVAWAGGAMAGITTLVALALLVDGLHLPGQRSDPTVELADEAGEAVVAQGEPLSDDERAALLAPFDPNRLRCEPEGCEVWRRDLVDRQGAHTNVAPLGDLVVVNVGNDITAYDAATGEERWQQRWPASESARASANWTSILGSEDGEVVVLARPERGDLFALRRDGSTAWHDDRVGQVHNLQVVGDTLLTSSQNLPAEPGAIGEAGASSEHLVGRDLASGTVRWEREAALMGASEYLLVAQEVGTNVLLDPTTGQELGRRDLGPDAWLYPVGEVLLSFGNDEQQALLSADLEPLPDLEDLTEVHPLADEGLVLALRHGRARVDDERRPDRLMLVDDRGGMRWSVDLDTSPRSARLCCPQPHVRDGVLVLPAIEDDGAWTALSLDDGTRVEVPPGTDSAPQADNVWWISARTAIEHLSDGMRLHHEGMQVAVQGQDSWPVTSEPPFVITNGRSLLGVQPVPQD
ncbi:MAG: PQQ-binding-like beta-propeller repeat protein [Egicoccus sp.]